MTQSEEEVAEIVQHKVRRAVGRRGLQDIARLVERWEEEEKADAKLWRATLAGLLVALIVVVVYGALLHGEAKVADASDMPRQGVTKP